MASFDILDTPPCKRKRSQRDSLDHQKGAHVILHIYDQCPPTTPFETKRARITTKGANVITPLSHAVIDLTEDSDSETSNSLSNLESMSLLGSFDFIDLTQDDDDSPNNVIDLTQDDGDSPNETPEFVASIGNATLERVLSDEEAFSDETDSEYEEWLASTKRPRRYRQTIPATPDSPICPNNKTVGWSDWLRNSSCEPDASDNTDLDSDTSSVDDFNTPDEEIRGLIKEVDNRASYCMKGDENGDWELDHTGNYFINTKTNEQCRKTLRIARGEGYIVETI
jgi:hypothetical protein